MRDRLTELEGRDSSRDVVVALETKVDEVEQVGFLGLYVRCWHTFLFLSCFVELESEEHKLCRFDVFSTEWAWRGGSAGSLSSTPVSTVQ